MTDNHRRVVDSQVKKGRCIAEGRIRGRGRPRHINPAGPDGDADCRSRQYWSRPTNTPTRWRSSGAPTFVAFFAAEPAVSEVEGVEILTSFYRVRRDPSIAKERSGRRLKALRRFGAGNTFEERANKDPRLRGAKKRPHFWGHNSRGQIWKAMSGKALEVTDRTSRTPLREMLTRDESEGHCFGFAAS